MRDFNHTVNVLVKAYFDGTLEHGNCSACAVGNIVADSINTKPLLREQLRELKVDCVFDNMESVAWGNVFMTIDREAQIKRPERFLGDARKQIESTGYTWPELARIEYAFEMATPSRDEDQFMFNGLMAVVEVLADIHGISLEAKETAKQLFVKV